MFNTTIRKINYPLLKILKMHYNEYGLFRKT